MTGEAWWRAGAIGIPLSMGVGPMVGRRGLPVTTSKLAIRQSVPWRLYSNSMRSVRPGLVGLVGWIRSSALLGRLTPNGD